MLKIDKDIQLPVAPDAKKKDEKKADKVPEKKDDAKGGAPAGAKKE